ncbi:MAG: DsbA family protein [Gemmatimonadota bacterium]
MRHGSLLIALGALTATAAWAGCARDVESAQDPPVVPSDTQVATERADKARAKGPEEAPVRIVEISDFQCPYCRQFHQETLGALDSAYIATGKANYVWISYANPGHAKAWPAIEAAFCAGAVGRFWPMHGLLFERQEQWSDAENTHETFVSYAKELGIDPASFASCMRDDRLAPLILRDYANVMRAGISSTPYFILADSVAIRGAAPFETFQTALDTLLVLRGGAN